MHRASVCRMPMLFVVAVLVGHGAARGASDTEEREALARKIEKTVEKLQQVREKRRAARKRHREARKKVRAEIERLEADREEARGAVKKKKQAVQALRKKLEKAKARRSRAKRTLSAVAERAEGVARAMRKRITTGVPYRRKRRSDRIDGVLGALGGEDAAKQGKAVGDLLSFATDELQRASETELWNAPVTLRGGERRVHAYHYRVGLAAEAFVAEDGEEVGLADIGADRSWVLDLGRARRRKVRDAVQILRKRARPRILPVPLVLPRAEGASGKDVSGEETADQGKEP